jgi:formylglycine-generating enzyme required for sulfatase activity
VKHSLYTKRNFLVLSILTIFSIIFADCSSIPKDEGIVRSIEAGGDEEFAGFVHIKGGTFMMGSPESEVGRYDGEVQHQVTVSSFYMSKYEVTQKEWYDVMETTLRQQLDKRSFKLDNLGGEGDNYPMYSVSWLDAIEYCNKRSLKEGLMPAYTIDKSLKDRNNKYDYFKEEWIVTWNKNANGYRLPTEAEWEYACRAGTTTPFNTGNNITTDQANYDGNYPYNNNAKGIFRETTTPVGSFAPNQWGLYDMHGNVWEWCWDWYGDYVSGSQVDPVGPSAGADRVVRGGGWRSSAGYLRSVNRLRGYPNSRYDNVGFRVARP